MADKQDDINNYYTVVLHIIKDAGKVLQEGFSKTKTVTFKSSSYDLVTEYDKNIEELLIKKISNQFPNHKYIGEETKNGESLTNEPTWIIDPIDGTTNFIHGYENCVISVALAVNKVLEIGIVYSPIKNQLFTAQRGKGAYLNGTPIHASQKTDIKESLVGFEISLAVSPRLKQKWIKRLDVIVSESHGIRSIGTCALSLCYVGLGAWDAYQVDYLYPWDYAAGVLIVLEAGGKVISTDGSPFEIMKRQVLAAGTNQLADQIVALFKKADL